MLRLLLPAKKAAEFATSNRTPVESVVVVVAKREESCQRKSRAEQSWETTVRELPFPASIIYRRPPAPAPVPFQSFPGDRSGHLYWHLCVVSAISSQPAVNSCTAHFYSFIVWRPACYYWPLRPRSHLCKLGPRGRIVRRNAPSPPPLSSSSSFPHFSARLKFQFLLFIVDFHCGPRFCKQTVCLFVVCFSGCSGQHSGQPHCSIYWFIVSTMTSSSIDKLQRSLLASFCFVLEDNINWTFSACQCNCRQECRPFVKGVLTTTASVIAITTSKKANNKQGQLGKMQLYGKCFWILFLYTLFTI